MNGSKENAAFYYSPYRRTREQIDILLVSKVTGLSMDRLKALQARAES